MAKQVVIGRSYRLFEGTEFNHSVHIGVSEPTLHGPAHYDFAYRAESNPNLLVVESIHQGKFALRGDEVFKLSHPGSPPVSIIKSYHPQLTPDRDKYDEISRLLEEVGL